MNRLVTMKSVSPGTSVRLGVGVIPIRGSGEFLLERRSDCGLWGLVGGRLEPGETVVGAAIREAKEETNLDLEFDHLLGIYSHPEGRLFRYEPSGDERHIVDIVLVMRVTSESPLVLSSESLNLAWFDSLNLPGKEEFLQAAWQPVQDFLSHNQVVVQ